MKFDTEFKTAISNLSSSEKDKLLFRLLKKDVILANQLLFELVDTETVEDKREKMEQQIKASIERMTNHFLKTSYLMMDLRYLSGDINNHVKVVKDKFGDASLNLLMLVEVLKMNNDKMNKESAAKTEKFNIYVIARAFKILILINQMNEDYLIEFKENLYQLGHLIGANHNLMMTAIHNGLDVNWLILAEIPDNIVAYHKNLKLNGFLK